MTETVAPSFIFSFFNSKNQCLQQLDHLYQASHLLLFSYHNQAFVLSRKRAVDPVIPCTITLVFLSINTLILVLPSFPYASLTSLTIFCVHLQPLLLLVQLLILSLLRFFYLTQHLYLLGVQLVVKCSFFTASTIPSAITSHFIMPPKMFTRKYL